MNLLTCHDVSFEYDNYQVISDLNFNVKQGDYLCIIGENGSGKSTLIKGLLKLKSPSKGTIVIGSDLKQSEIGYLPQQTDIQRDFPASVYEVVLSGCLNHMGMRPFYGKKEKELAVENMKRLGIEELKQCSYRELSGGQQQRVLLARALCATKKILLLDEPVSGLDPIVTADLYQLIKWINEELKITIIMVSHDLGQAIRFGSHILHLKNKQLFFGAKEDYIKSDVYHQMFGGIIND